ncbi:MAG TPA: 16S rRNA (cytosine(1402)-N(4))-methyltransferase RsmH [Phycisphaerae bacterium]|nr:16S rRNA (cytosine(1402)-N(4))-methyltransferase RsmH [Phycisphaerae bacterium]
MNRQDSCGKFDKARHRPVLREEVTRLLFPGGKQTGGRILDCTIGLGGHASGLLEASGKDAQLVGMDADEDNVILSRKNLGSYGTRVRFFHANFAQVRKVLTEVGWTQVHAVLADLGFSSNQMDDPMRGMSFLRDGLLDMRFDRHAPRTAADIVNQVGEKDLADLIYAYGEERRSRRIARAIVTARRRGRIERTVELAEIISRAMPHAARKTRRGIHPATRTFQALRIAVNDELTNLERLLDSLGGILATGGRAAIISFHSLEDRRVKRAFASLTGTGQAIALTKKPIVPSAEEIAANPRSRSAKLRALEKTGSTAFGR